MLTPLPASVVVTDVAAAPAASPDAAAADVTPAAVAPDAPVVANAPDVGLRAGCAACVPGWIDAGRLTVGCAPLAGEPVGRKALRCGTVPVAGAPEPAGGIDGGVEAWAAPAFGSTPARRTGCCPEAGVCPGWVGCWPEAGCEPGVMGWNAPFDGAFAVSSAFMKSPLAPRRAHSGSKPSRGREPWLEIGRASCHTRNAREAPMVASSRRPPDA